MKPVTGHLVQHYLGLTETFIYAYLAHAQRFQPLALTDVLRNQTSFPASCIYLCEQEEAESLRREMGPGFNAWLRKMDYPCCFEPFLREQGVALLHAHFGTTGYKALRLKRRLGLPLVTSFYGVDASMMLALAGWRCRYRRLFDEGDLFLTLGEGMADRLQAAGCPDRKIRIQHMGVDVDRIAFRPRHWPDGSPVLLYCGRLVKKRGCSLLFWPLPFWQTGGRLWCFALSEPVRSRPILNGQFDTSGWKTVSCCGGHFPIWIR